VTGDKCEGDRFCFRTFIPVTFNFFQEEKTMALAKTFEELRIWQNSRVLVGQIYATFKVDSGKYRDYAFRDQIQRAAVSVMNNISEGFERGTKADFARFLDVAKGSCG